MCDLLAQHSESRLSLPDAGENEAVSAIGQILDCCPSVADGHLLEGHDVLKCSQRAFATEHTLEIAEAVLVEEPDDGADARRVCEDADAVVPVEERPAELVL